MGYFNYNEKEIGNCEECHEKPAKHYLYISGIFWCSRRFLCTKCHLMWKKHHEITLRD